MGSPIVRESGNVARPLAGAIPAPVFGDTQMAKAKRKSAPASVPAPAPETAPETTLSLVVPPTPTADDLAYERNKARGEARERALREIAVGGGRNADFALSLIMAIRSGKVSEKQQFHADRLADEYLNPAPALNCLRVMDAYRALPAGMKRFPKIHTVIGGVMITLSYTAPTSDKAKPDNRGTCAIASGKYGTPESKYYGRIMQDGTFVAGHHITDAVREWITSLATDAPLVWQY